MYTIYNINGHFRNLNWRYLPYIRPIVQAYVREYPHKIWPYMVQYLHFRILKFPLITCILFIIFRSQDSHHGPISVSAGTGGAILAVFSLSGVWAGTNEAEP